ncbi:hypothetical protein, conserved [Entamoeba dispar SAW760]|uniref:Leucine rich repeat containing protein BspA family protein n=1 Tax=Entamoeba dispar (strain ATCC PRA-260 / SAW760) TaxID=370354 RepID=B0EQB5_ENTDS|nr:uncharacterized protein EDI_282060 [Entamoeba dispar SAW760]EDR23281.1 hypothetical protein, conserved [Entamoeba dispar SAW760]|eukprot:EDR23281.1 hypothetical protein, conserved [Entamoeba dispar SAW760]
MKLGYNEIMITSMYFNDIKDFINLEIGIKRFQGNTERFHFNPIPLDEYSRKFFPNIETFHIYNEEDEEFDDGRIFKKVIWYDISYSQYLKEKEEGNECKHIKYTESDREKYGCPIPKNVSIIGENCFKDCYDLTTLNIPTTITKLGNKCFDQFWSLTSITIATTIKELWESCFDDCYSLTNISNENLMFVSKERIFMNEAILMSIKTPKNLQTINGKRVKMKNINQFNIPSSIHKLANNCFKECTLLTTIIIPTTINELGKNCFAGCSSLKEIVIPTTINELPDYCFYKCKSLSDITIPSTITSFGKYCFLWMCVNDK